MTAPHDHRLEQALRDLTVALTATGASWMVIGGIAVIARGVRRFTTDIDAATRLEPTEINDQESRGADAVELNKPWDEIAAPL